MNGRIWGALFLLGIFNPFGSTVTAKDANEFVDVDDDEFAEFDDADDESQIPPKEQIAETEAEEEEEEEGELKVAQRDEPQPRAESEEEEEEAVVEEEESEFSHFEDDEEFEGYNQDDDEDEDDDEGDEFEHDPKIKSRGARADRRRDSKTSPPPPPKTINIAKIPAHLRNNWESYYLELLMIAGLVVYLLNFFTGRVKNQKIADAWYSANKALLEANFALVGDDGAKDVEDVESPLQKESENQFILWCSGRTCCEGMLVEIRLLKRQDLVSVIGDGIKPGHNRDQVRIRVHMNPDDMDSFVFCLAQKKTAAKLSKDMADINTYCPEKRNVLEKYGLPVSVSSNYTVNCEIPEVIPAMLDSKMVAVLTKYPDAIDSIHCSDQYTGPKLPDDQQVQDLPTGKKVLIFTFNINIPKGSGVDEAMEGAKPMLMLVFYFIDKIKRFRLSRDGKNKADKNRTKVSEAFWKSVHAMKAEKAQEERERKRREIKEKIKEIEDPEKQRKLEEKELRRERKKAAPKMKQLKVKAM